MVWAKPLEKRAFSKNQNRHRASAFCIDTTYFVAYRHTFNIERTEAMTFLKMIFKKLIEKIRDWEAQLCSAQLHSNLGTFDHLLSPLFNCRNLRCQKVVTASLPQNSAAKPSHPRASWTIVMKKLKLRIDNNYRFVATTLVNILRQ